MTRRLIAVRAFGRLTLVLASTAALQAGCGQTATPVPQPPPSAPPPSSAPRPTPAPTFASVDSASSTDVLRYGSTLEFTDDRSFADTATIVEGTRQALIRFSPEIGSRTITTADLKRGRIAARWLRFGDSVRYPIRSMMGFVWIDSVPTGWRVLYFSSDSSLGRTLGQALTASDARYKDGYPLPKAPVVLDSVGTFHCYYTDLRWVCPRFSALTQSRVDSGYGAR